METIWIGFIVLVLAVVAALSWAEWLRNPRPAREGEHVFKRDDFPLFMKRPATGASVSSLVQAAIAAVPCAELIRYRLTGPGSVELDVVVPWSAVEPWVRRIMARDVQDAIELLRPAGVVVDTRITWR